MDHLPKHMSVCRSKLPEEDNGMLSLFKSVVVTKQQKFELFPQVKSFILCTVDTTKLNE